MKVLTACTLVILLSVFAFPGRGEPVREKMFEIEKTEVVKEAVEIRGCRVEPKEGHVLFVCKVKFTKAGSSISNDDFAKLDVSKASKEFAKLHGPLIGRGDFQLRLKDKTLVPCSCLPQSSEQPGPKVRVKAAKGEDDWLMYVGAVQLLAAVKPNAEPVALIWGGKYEVAISTK
jgi:hypothetical protein